jgi:replicative DNA helicase
LAELVECVPSSGNIEYYAKIVQEHAVIRDLIATANDIGRKSRDPQQNIHLLIKEAKQRIDDLQVHTHKRGRLVKDILPEVFFDLEKVSENKSEITGLQTGFIDLDRTTSGLQKSDLIIVAARPAIGKTALAINIGTYISTRLNVPGLITSFEMGDKQLVLRMLSSEARIDSKKLRTGNLEQEDWDKLAAATDRLSLSPMVIEEKLQYVEDVEILAMEWNRYFKNQGIKEGLGYLIVDYLQLMDCMQQTQNREQQIAYISRTLKRLAQELNIPVIALSQLNRALENRADKHPQLSDLRESGSIEQDADIILFIYRDEVYNEDSEKKGIAEIIIAKHRNGPTGMVELAFMSKYTKFANLARHEHP